MNTAEQQKIDNFKKFTSSEKINKLLDTYKKHIEINPDDSIVQEYITVLSERKRALSLEKGKISVKNKKDLNNHSNAIENSFRKNISNWNNEKRNTLLQQYLKHPNKNQEPLKSKVQILRNFVNKKEKIITNINTTQKVFSKYTPVLGAPYYDFIRNIKDIKKLRNTPGILVPYEKMRNAIPLLKKQINKTIKQALHDGYEEIYPNMIGGGFGFGKDEHLNPKSFYNDKISLASSLILELSQGKDSGISKQKYEKYIKLKLEKSLSKNKNPIQYINSLVKKQSLYKEITPEIVQKIHDGVVNIQLPGGTSGSGFYIGKNIIITNNHVVHYKEKHKNKLERFPYSAKSLIIKNLQGKQVNAHKIITSPNKDLAIIIVEQENHNYFKPAVKNVQEGENIYHAGYGEEYLLWKSNNVPTITIGSEKYIKTKDGFLSTTRRPGTESSSSGDSGGPMINNKGEFVGITTKGILEYIGTPQLNIKLSSGYYATGLSHTKDDIMSLIRFHKIPLK